MAVPLAGRLSGGLVLPRLLAATPGRAGAGADDPGRDRAGGVRRPRKSVIFLFMEGGPSHIDLFDPKPLLNKLAGKPLPPSFKPVITPMGEFHSPLLASKRKWKQHGESGAWVSDWLPHIAECVDDLAVIRSCWSNGLNHVGGVCQMNTGSILAGRPSLGSWVSYGLGTENQNLPGFVVMQDNAEAAGGRRPAELGRRASCPPSTRGPGSAAAPSRSPTCATPKAIGDDRQREQARLPRPAQPPPRPRDAADQTELDARIQSYELAFRMQAEAPEAVDLAGETDETRPLYGLDDKATASLRPQLPAGPSPGRARRPVRPALPRRRRKWDVASGHREEPPATLPGHGQAGRRALIKDLKRRGLLDETLVVWGGEFGRTPMSEKGDGRDHNPYGFTMWMAGGGIQPGVDRRPTDEVGLHADRGPAPRPRPARHDPPLPGRRPLAADLSPPGPPRASDGQRGGGLGEDHRLSRRGRERSWNSPTRLALASLVLALIANAPTRADFALRDGDTVVFLGDSITAARTYGKIVENYTLLRFPDRHGPLHQRRLGRRHRGRGPQAARSRRVRPRGDRPDRRLRHQRHRLGDRGRRGAQADLSRCDPRHRRAVQGA